MQLFLSFFFFVLWPSVIALKDSGGGGGLGVEGSLGKSNKSAIG